MKKQESLLSEKFSKDKMDTNSLSTIKGGDTASSGDCHGTGCSEQTGSSGAIRDWEDIECGDTLYAGSVKCPIA